MTLQRALPLVLGLAPLLACGDNGTDTSASGTGGTTQGPTTTPMTTGNTTTEQPTTSASAGSTSDGSGGATEGQTTTSTSTSTTGTTGPDTTGGASTGAVLSTSGGGSTTTTGPDTTTGNDTDCGGGGGDIEFSFIWIANSPEGTVSKVDTETLVEVGRYRTGATLTDPSRTSVNLKGDVAIVNRDGSITKIGAVPDQCKDTNGQPGIQTSSGPNDVLPWGQDDCALWNTPLLPASRPVAWTSGEPFDPDDPCSEFVNEKVWTSAPQGSDAFVYLLDGETGAIINQVLVPGANGGLGIYGGAVDGNNDFWGVTYSQGPLVHVEYDTFQAETIPLPGFSGGAYGFTVDSKGRSWVGGWDGSLIRYDPADGMWVKVDIPAQYPVLSRGMTEDKDGHLWAAALFPPNGLLRVDTDTATFVEFIGPEKLTGVNTPTGASIDVQGKIWLVDQAKDGGGAFVYNPTNQEVKWVGGLNGPYTYSDMTGHALKNVVPM